MVVATTFAEVIPSAGCDCLDTVTYTQQTDQYDATASNGGGAFDEGTTEVGMWANNVDGGDVEYAAAWKTFRTDSATSSDARPLQIGDEFTITVYTFGVYYGQLGVSFNDGHSTGSWDNRVSNSRFSIQQNGANFGSGGGIGSWYVDDNDSDPSFNTTPAGDSGANYEIKVKITSSSTFNAEINSANKKYDLPMKGSPGATDRIDGYSIYLSDDRNKVWDQFSRQNSYWKQTVSVEDTGAVEFGGDDGTRTIAGRIADGMGAACDSGSCANKVYKIGTGTITLSDTGNTYTGGTEIQAGTLSVSADGCLGAAPGAADADNIYLNGAGAALVASDTFTLNANRGMTLGNWGYLGVASGEALTYNGVIAGAYNLVKNQAGELILGGNNTFGGSAYVDAGTLTLNHASAGGVGGIYLGMESGSDAATLNLGSAITVANNLTVRDGSSGIKYFKAADTATLSGTLAISETTENLLNVDVASGETLTMSGVISGTGGGEITKTGAGTLVMSNTGNTHDKKVTVTAGTLQMANSRNLGADPAGAYADKLTLDGGTLAATASFTMHANNSTTLGASHGTIDVAASQTLTYPAAISGSGNLTKTGSGTLTLSGDNPYTGNTTVSAGTVIVTSWSDDSAFTVASGATLMGDGAVDALTVNGEVDPGDTAAARGSLTVDGAVVLNAGGSLQVDISNVSGTAGTDWDLIAGGGAITPPGSGTFTVYVNDEGTPGFSSATAYSWKIVGGSSVGSFNASYFSVDTSQFSAGLDGGVFSVANSGSDGTGLYLVFTPAAADPPSAFSVSAASVSSMTLTFTPNGSGDNVVIVYDEDGTFSAPSGAPPAVGNPFAGGTVVYNGTMSPQTHSGLDSCTRYYYKAWSYDGGNYSTTGLEADATTDPPAAPAIAAASDIGTTNFTANWGSVSGATGYRLDVSSTEFGGGGGGGLFISEVTDPSDVANAKYVELYNASGSAIDFDSTTWYLSRQANGGSWASVQLTGSIADGATYTIAYNTTYDTEYSDTADLYNGTVISGNGDDGYFLCQGGDYSSGTIIDAYGVINQDGSGYAWEYTDSHAVRNSDVISGSNTWTSSEWTITSAGVAAMTPHSHTASGGGGAPTYVDGFEDLAVAGTSQVVTGLVGDTTYYYRVRAEGGGGCASADSDVENVTTAASLVTTDIDNTGTPATGTIAAGGSDVVVFGFRLTPTGGNINFTGLDLTTAGTATTDDLSSFEVVYDANGNGVYDGGDSIVSSAAQALAGTITFTITGQTGFGTARRYLVIADVSVAATGGRTITCSIADPSDVGTTGIEDGTASGNAQTITTSCAIDNTGAPGVGSLTVGAANAVVFGFRLTPAGLIDFTGLDLTTTGTATTDDLSNFEVVYDANGNGVVDGGDSTVSSAAQALGGTISFTITGQTGFSAARRYLVIADVASGATPGRTITCSIADPGDVTTTGTESGAAAGSQQTLSVAEPTTHSSDIEFSDVELFNMTIDWTPGDGTRRIVVVKVNDVVNWEPTDGTPPDPLEVNANFPQALNQNLGNRICYDGAGSSFTLTGLDMGRTYHVKIFEYTGTGSYVNYLTSGSPAVDSMQTACPAAPVVAAGSDITTSSFTANWAASTGATGYLLDVSETPFGVSGGDLLISQYIDTDSGTTPKGIEIWNATGADITFNGTDKLLDIKIGVNGGAPSSVVTVNSGTLVAGDVWVIGTADMSPDVTQGFTFNGDDSIVLELGGVVQDVFGNPGSDPGSAWSGGGVSTEDQNIQLKSGITTGDTDGWTDPSERFEYVANGSTLTGFGTPPSGGGGGAIYVSGYENRAVSGTSESVTGLDSDETYYYRVRAAGSNSCVSVNSDVMEVTTSPGQSTVVLGDNGTQIGVGNVGAGATEHVLYRFQMAVTAAKAYLTGVSFTTAGSYDAADVTALRVWYSEDNSFATTGDNTQLGSDITASLGTGSHAVSGFSQAILQNTTGYVFLTVDVAGSPVYGHTINVQAVTAGNLTFVDSSVSGTPSVGGAQTIVANEPTTHASALLFSDVEATQMGLSWTSGNGERRIVMVREGGAVSLPPSDGTAPDPLDVDADFSAATDQGSGNKICYDGTGTNVTLTGLTPGATYHVAVYEYNGTGIYVNYYTAGAPTGSQTAACPTAPENLHVTWTNDVEFTAAWDAVAGATGYRLDVSLNPFGSGGGITVFRETMGNVGGTTTIAFHESNNGFDNDDYTMSDGGAASSGDLRNTSPSTGGYTDPEGNGASGLANVWFGSSGDGFGIAGIDASGYTGLKLSFGYYKMNASANATFDVQWSTNNGTGWNTLAVTNMPAAGASALSWYNVETEVLPAGAASTNLSLRWVRGGTESMRIDDALLRGAAVPPVYVGGYEDRAVSGTSQNVTNLDASTIYYFRLRTEGPNGCLSDNSYPETITTLALPLSGILIGGTPLNFGGVMTNSVSGELTYLVSGLDLTDDIVITAPGNFEVSTNSGSGFGSSVTLTPTGGTVAETTIYVRFTPLSLVSYSGNILHTSTGHDNVTLGVSGYGVVEGPSTQASDLAVTAVSHNMLELGWTRGTGDRVLIVGRQSSEAEAPVGGETYSAHTNWILAGTVPVDGSSRAVAITNGTTAAVYSLNPATRYYFAAYEFTGYGFSGFENYLTTAAPTTDVWTLSTPPAGHVTSFRAENITSSTLDLSWTPAPGVPSGYLILQRIGAEPESAPQDATNYTVGASIGLATVAAIVTPGTEIGVTLSGLDPDTMYYYTIYPYRWNGTTNATYNYYTETPVPVAYGQTADPNVIKDHFEGTVTHGLHNASGGTNWVDNWDTTGSAQTWVHATNSLPGPAGYPTGYGNHIVTESPLAAGENVAVRHFEPFTTGRIYASGLLMYEYANSGTYLGLALMSNTTEMAFAGRPLQDQEKLGLDVGGVQTMSEELFWAGSAASPHYQAVVMMYDFGTSELKAWIFEYMEEGIPVQEPPPAITRPLTAGTITSINGLKVVGGGNIGHIWFDEVRVSDSWAGLLDQAISNPEDAPDVQAYDLFFDNERQDQFEVSWVPGNGTKTLVVVKQGGPVDAFPVDGNVYSGDPEYGAGSHLGGGNFVLYSGSDTNRIVMTGLDPATTYHVRAFEFNQTASTHYQTNTARDNPGSYSTLAPPNPTLGLSGTNATDLTWTKFNNRNVMIVYCVGSAVMFTPTDTTPYSDAEDLGSGQYVLQAESSGEHYVHTGLTADTTVHYRFFSVNNGYFSEGVDRSITLTAASVIHEPFSDYDPGGANDWWLNGLNGGTGWASAWSCAANIQHKVDAWGFGEGNRSIPTPSNRRGQLVATANGSVLSADRYFTENFTTGVVYISWLMLYDHAGDNRYCGLHVLTDGGSDPAFIGKVAGSANFGINWSSDDRTSARAAPNATELFCVLKYDFDSDELSANVYPPDSHVAEEPVGSLGEGAYWDVMTTQTISSIKGIRIKAGIDSDPANNIGNAYFGEIRAGRDWYAVTRRDGLTHRTVMDTGPVPELIFIGENYDPLNPPAERTYVFDSEISNTNSPISFAVRWSSPNGLFVTNDATMDTFSSREGNVTPNWDPMVKSGADYNPIGMDTMFTGVEGINGALSVTSYHNSAFTSTNFGSGWDLSNEFFITVSAQTMPAGDTVTSAGVDVPVRRGLTVNYPLPFTIQDNDVTPPALQGFTRPLSTNILENVTDADIATGTFVLTGMVRDAQSGVQADSLRYSLFTPAGQTAVDNSAFGTRPTVDGTATNFMAVADTVTGVNPDHIMLGAWTARVWATDFDNDRPGDAQQAQTDFAIHVVDDDSSEPIIWELTVGGTGGSGSSNLTAGAVAVIGVNGYPLDDDDDRFAFVVLAPFPAGTEIFFTDCGWTTTGNTWGPRISEFLASGHTNSWIAPNDFAAGTVFEIELPGALNSQGDQIVAFQYHGTDHPTTDPTNCTFISALNMDYAAGGAPGWDSDPMPDFNYYSCIYPGLTNGVNAVTVPLNGDASNVKYQGPTAGTATELLAEICDASNWTSYGSVRTNLDLTSEFEFNVPAPGADFVWETPDLTDEQVREGGYPVTNSVQDIGSGLVATNTAYAQGPYYVLLNSDSEVVVSNALPVNFATGDKSLVTMSMSAPTGNYENITLGLYEVSVVVHDADSDRSEDSLSSARIEIINVIDDDTEAPVVGVDRMQMFLGDEELTSMSTNALMSGWNFNSSDTSRSHGLNGAMTHTFAVEPVYQTGSDVNLAGSDEAGVAFTPQGYSQNNGGYIQFQLDMRGFENLEMTFAVRGTATGFTDNQVSYSIDGVSFTDLGGSFDPADGTFTQQTFDFSSASELNGAGTAFVRITLNGGSSGAGNNRFDNFQFRAVPLKHFEVTDGTLAAIDGATPWWMSFHAYDTYSGLRRGTTGDGTNMSVTIESYTTNNTAQYDYLRSTVDTTVNTATNIWRFPSGPSYEEIGDLFGDGNTIRRIAGTLADDDNDRPGDMLFGSNVVFGTFVVSDDDPDVPEITNVNFSGAAAAPFVVVTNAAAPVAPTNHIRNYISRRTGSGTNIVTAITDAELAAAGDIGLQFVFGARDAYSGVSRGTSGDTNTVMNFSIGDIVVGNYQDFNATASCGAFTNRNLTNYWTFDNTTFSRELITDLVEAPNQTMWLTVPDLDDDRPNDRGTVRDHQVGQLRVVDDDVRGPMIGWLSIDGIADADAMFYESFESDTGWEGLSFNGSWTHVRSNGTYIATGNVLWGTLDPKVTGTSRIGLLTNVAATLTALQLPPYENPGTLTAMAGRFGAEDPAEDVEIRVDWLDDAVWTSLGAHTVSNLNPEFEMFTWNINRTGVVTMRIVRVTTTGPQVYMDDINITPFPEWTNTNQLEIAWAEAVDDFSNVEEYRFVAPSRTPVLPSAVTDGVARAVGVTNETYSLSDRDRQGELTGYLFAYDDDDDRDDDYSIGSIRPIVARIDRTPPTGVPGLTASNEAVEDVTSQFDLQWNIATVGPDNPAHADYPTWGGGTRSLLSPWQTYKIYYGPQDDMDAAQIAAFINATNYQTDPAWQFVTWTNEIIDPVVSGTTNYLALSNSTRNVIRLYDLEVDQEYLVVIAGVDEAGNEGPVAADGWATNNTVKFSVTNAWMVPKTYARQQFGSQVATNTPASNTVALGWTAAGNKEGVGAVTRHYDLIAWDDPAETLYGFKDRTNNTWKLVTSVKTNWFVDDAGQFRGRGRMRFYRAAMSNRWNKLAHARPQASEEVYAMHNVVLSEGHNYVGLHGVPYTNTFAAVFGTDTNLWPGGSTMADGSTKIEFYSSGTNTILTDTYWFSSEGEWYKDGQPTPVTHFEMSNSFFTRGFSITLPKPLPEYYQATTAYDSHSGETVPAMIWSPVLQVPTNAPGGGNFSQVIHCGERGGTGTGQWYTGVYNLVVFNLPVAKHPHHLGLLESGFTPASSPATQQQGDYLYIVDTSRKAPLGNVYYYDNSVKSTLPVGEQWRGWKTVGGNQSLSDFGFIKPNDLIVIVSKNGGLKATWTWEYHPDQFYERPTRFMGW